MEDEGYTHLWGDETVQAKLQGCYQNKSLYEDISRDMGKHGFKRSWLQCQGKIKSLKSKYKSVKDHNNKSGNSRATFPFYDQMEDILGDRPSLTVQFMLLMLFYCIYNS
uniref:Myb/SANT-like DNA-binding domain-containing protein n=1 Tax=Oryzias sinensis TaxID=183150 RepID=A0A8C7Y6B5_9TELE